MSKNHDIYSINGRIKNIIAKDDIALSPVGTILVNYYCHALKAFYDYSDKLPAPFKEELQAVIEKEEDLPKKVIEASTPKEEYESLYDQVMNAKVQFASNEEALEHFIQEYKDLTEAYGLKDHEFWLEAEAARYLTDDHRAIMRLARGIHMLKYLIAKAKETPTILELGDDYADA